jgi:Na+/H+ antiporter NhaD/arsenite permease-like protein
MNSLMTIITNLPFFLLLLCIAFLPLVHEKWWEKNLNKAAVVAIFSTISIYCFFRTSPQTALHAMHSSVTELIEFFVLMFSLYIVSGGIVVKGIIKPSPKINCIILAIGALSASFIGTTGASMLLIHPLLRANSNRKHNAHTVIFFIFMVSNIGGCLTPLGDPPLFIGYLKGIPFLWDLNLFWQWLIINSTLLAIYYMWDVRIYLHRDFLRGHLILKNRDIKVRGKRNFIWVGLIICCIAFLTPNNTASLHLPHFFREMLILTIAFLSFFTTDREFREENRFCFSPIVEVGILFTGIFLCMPPVLQTLQNNAGLLPLNQAWQYFWTTGFLSSFLDNTPTYAVFFELAASGSVSDKYGQMVAASNIPFDILRAISAGSVFMGAFTYIGNGPNLMVKAIAEKDGIRMPGFFGYMCYSIPLLLPIFAVISLVWFR